MIRCETKYIASCDDCHRVLFEVVKSIEDVMLQALEAGEWISDQNWNRKILVCRDCNAKRKFAVELREIRAKIA